MAEDQWVAALREFVDLVATDPVQAIGTAPKHHPVHLRALLGQVRADAQSAGSDAARTFFARSARAVPVLDVAVGHLASLAKAVRHARKMQDDRLGLRSAVVQHFFTVMGSGNEPTAADLALWDARGLRPDGFWPWPIPEGFVVDPHDTTQLFPTVDADPPTVQGLRSWAAAILGEAGGWETVAMVPPAVAPADVAPPDVYADERGRTRCIQTSKLCYIDPETAKRERIHAKRVGPAELSIRSYQCRFCGLWHNTSMPLAVPVADATAARD